MPSLVGSEMCIRDRAEPTPDAMVEPQEQACDPPLQLSAAISAVSPDDLARLRAEGGTGAWVFEHVQNRSGGLLNATTGAFLAGPTPDVVDEFRLTDRGCTGEALFSLRIVKPMGVFPAAPEVSPGQVLTFEVEDGSGQFTLEMVANQTGAAVEGQLTYRAGPTVGQDTLRIVDDETGYSVQVKVEVKDEIRIVVSPVSYTHLTLPTTPYV